jgi:hypothetical protein
LPKSHNYIQINTQTDTTKTVMINNFSQRYLSELKAAQQKVNAVKLLNETHSDESSHEVLSQSSELKVELGPFKLNLSNNRTFASNNTAKKGLTQSLNKDKLSSEYEEQHSETNRSIGSPQEKQTLGRRVNLTL